MPVEKQTLRATQDVLHPIFLAFVGIVGVRGVGWNVLGVRVMLGSGSWSMLSGLEYLVENKP